MIVGLYSGWDDHDYFWVPLPKPIPAPLAQIMAEARKWDKEHDPLRKREGTSR